jgi:hypothetical protein
MTDVAPADAQHGELLPGQSLVVKEGTEFDVTPTGRS